MPEPASPSAQFSAALLGYGRVPVTYTHAAGLRVDLSAVTPDVLPCQWAWVIQLDGVS